MRASSVVLVLSLGGCLYVGDINDAPTAEIELESKSSSETLRLGGFVTLNAIAGDSSDDELSYSWRVLVQAGGERLELVTTKSPHIVRPLAADARPSVIGELESLSLDGLPRRGTYEVQLEVHDQLGAVAHDVYSFEVVNQDPKPVLVMAVDPEWKPRTVSIEEGGPYPVHAPYVIMLDPEETQDHEGDLVCGRSEAAGVRYTVEQVPEGATASTRIEKCKGEELGDRLKIQLAGGTGGQLVVSAVVDDGHGGTSTAELAVKLADNRPPCICGFSPEVGDPPLPVQVASIGGPVIPFRVTFTHDDLWYGLGRFHYEWQVRDEPADVFRPIPGAADEPTFHVPELFRAPGEEIELRVIIQDNTPSASPSCDEDTSFCEPEAVPSAWPQPCYRWVTWRVQFV